jgi:hypothetical protein
MVAISVPQSTSFKSMMNQSELLEVEAGGHSLHCRSKYLERRYLSSRAGGALDDDLYTPTTSMSSTTILQLRRPDFESLSLSTS